MPAAFLANLSIPERAAGWRRAIEGDRDKVHVFEEAGVVQGWVAIGKSVEGRGPDEGEIYALYVDPNHWRRAIGGALIRHAEQKLWARGFQSVALWVLEQNNLARAFYVKCGYAEEGGRKTEEMAGAKLVELRFRKKSLPG